VKSLCAGTDSIASHDNTDARKESCPVGMTEHNECGRAHKAPAAVARLPGVSSCAEMLLFAELHFTRPFSRGMVAVVAIGATMVIRRAKFQPGTFEEAVMAMSEAKKKDLKGRRAAPLVTPSDLGAKASQEIAGGMNAILADVWALYLKTKNFHWHMSGPHFRDYHLLLDEQADQLYAMSDPIAERIRKVGGNTLRSIGHIARLQRVKDNDADYVEPLDMLAELREDNQQLAARLREVHDVVDEARDIATASLIENWIDETERRTWFLFEASRRS
jgi:starvation-inducible DNA-binding protein